jgi:eukaryotic-like serine/threonine-protein kinase
MHPSICSHVSEQHPTNSTCAAQGDAFLQPRFEVRCNVWIGSSSLDNIQLMLGGVIGNYRITRSIGEGGMGAVYEAEHVLLGRRAAVKVLLREMSHQQDLITRFFNEARAATTVKHPGIVEIYDFGYHTDGSAYIVMEYLAGESLASRLKRCRVLLEVRATALCRQIAGALVAAHARGIVHRDLKPDNIFIVPDPDVVGGERTKVLDFGIAKLAVGDLAMHSITRTGAVMGTPPYMSPEQCKGAGAIDHRADLYALGCILFEMSCGRPPFVAEGGGEIMAQHIYAAVPAPSSIGPVTPQLEQVILRALEKEPSCRFQSAEEMIDALQSVMTSAQFGVAAPNMPVDTRHAPAPLTSPAPTLSELPLQGAGTPVAPQVTTLGAASVSTHTTHGLRRIHRPRRAIVGAIVCILGVLAIAMVLHGGDHEDAVVTSRASATTTTSSSGAAISAPATGLASSSLQPRPTETPTPSPPSPSPSRHSIAIPPPSSTATAKPILSPATEDGPSPSAPTPLRVAIKLTSEPVGADVYRMPQGERVGRTPLDYVIEERGASITLLFRRKGYADRQITIPLADDSIHNVTLMRSIAKRTSQPASLPTIEPDPGSATTPMSGSLDPFEKLGPSKRRNEP